MGTYLCLGVAVGPELRRLAQQATSKPWAVPLSLVRNHLHLQPTTLCSSTANLAGSDPRIHELLDITL